MAKRKDAAAWEPPAEPPQRALAPRWKAALSVLLALHVLAVFVTPFTFACTFAGEAPFAERLHALFRPYVGAMFLEHGYAFFAPDPDATHSVRYRIEFDDGREPVEGVFPDLSVHQPRLLYHRHFMLAEELFRRYEPPQSPAEPSPPPLTASNEARDRYRLDREAHARVVKVWEHRRRVHEAMRQSVEQHLLTEHGGARVTVTVLERRPLDRVEVRELRMRPGDPDTVRELSETPLPGGER